MTTTTTTGTTLEILAPYLPYGIEVEMLYDKYKGLRGELLKLHTREDRAFVREVNDEYWAFSQFLPVLRSFADLCTPLPDGTVPVDEIRQLWGLYAMDGDNGPHNEMVLAILNGKYIGKYAMDLDLDFEEVGAAYDYLRRNHFALPVNGKPLVEGRDYIRKGAAA